MTAPLDVPAPEFASAGFWRRLDTLATGRGHHGHPTMLVGHVEPTDQYALRCMQCDQVVAAISVQR